MIRKGNPLPLILSAIYIPFKTQHFGLCAVFYLSLLVDSMCMCKCRLISVLESMDNGKSIRESRDCDIPIVARHLYHHSGEALLTHAATRLCFETSPFLNHSPFHPALSPSHSLLTPILSCSHSISPLPYLLSLLPPSQYTCRMGSVDGRGDEGVGTYWSCWCNSPMEFSFNVAIMEGNNECSQALHYISCQCIGIMLSS